MQEARKTNAVRGQDFVDTYFAGRVIDIGCGPDLVVPHGEPFDLEHGDANRIDEVRDREAYDCVHSSHCLEHMHDPEDAIRRWWALVRPGGHLIIVVPEEDLYEQGVWPSRFNSDHKSTFTLDRPTSWSPCSFDLAALARGLPDASIISAAVQDQGFDYALHRPGPESLFGKFIREQMMRLYHRMHSKGLLTMDLLKEMNAFFAGLGGTVDQTLGPALAQIQIVIRKNVVEK